MSFGAFPCFFVVVVVFAWDMLRWEEVRWMDGGPMLETINTGCVYVFLLCFALLTTAG